MSESIRRYLADQAETEVVRKDSLDQRALAITSVGGALTAISLALVPLSKSSNFFTLRDYRSVAGIALILMAISMVLAIGSNVVTYSGAPVLKDLEKLVRSKTADMDAEALTLDATFEEYKRRRQSNAIRAWVLACAQVIQACSAVLLMWLAWKAASA